MGSQITTRRDLVEYPRLPISGTRIVKLPKPNALSPEGWRMKINDIRHGYHSTNVIQGLSLGIRTNETLVILGHSGCGKTTLLRIAAGILIPAEGTIELDGIELKTIPIAQRRVVYIDQEPLLFEHLTVQENLAFSLKLRKLSPNVIKEKTLRLLDAVGLSAHATKRSWELSGGQKQRVAFARAILAEPKVLLLDEPFGALDSRTRQEMHALYQQLAEQYRFTAVLVTHDVREALVLGNRFATMRSGTLHCYDNIESFINSDQTGVRDEFRFWNDIQSKHS